MHVRVRMRVRAPLGLAYLLALHLAVLALLQAIGARDDAALLAQRPRRLDERLLHLLRQRVEVADR